MLQSTSEGDRLLVNAFTVDVEDYFQVQAFADRVSRERWNDFPSRVVDNTHRILRLLDEQSVRGTFFILGWVADRFPSLVRDIVCDGHDLGCHSYWHRLIYELTPEEFADDLRRATDAIASITGEQVCSYRAPSFSITRRSMWALEILAENGYDLDSSIFPIRHDNYGITDADTDPHTIALSSGRSIREFPLTVCRIAGTSIPIAGGGYFRLAPLPAYCWALRRVNDKEGRNAVFYIHPWEVDPDQPRIAAPLRSRFRHYQNLRTAESKLCEILESFRWGTLEESWASAAKRLDDAET